MTVPRLIILMVALLVVGPAGKGEAPEAAAARVADLEAQLRERAAEVQRLQAQLADLRRQLASVGVAVSREPAAGRSPSGRAPRSGLDPAVARKAAAAARLMVPGAGLLSVLPTGSMQPTFDEHAVLLTEAAPFDDLRVGDIVTYRHPDYPVPVVHRLREKRGDRFWSRGDGNGRMDDVYVTRENYERRVFGIIYSNGPVAPDLPR